MPVTPHRGVWGGLPCLLVTSSADVPPSWMATPESWCLCVTCLRVSSAMLLHEGQGFAELFRTWPRSPGPPGKLPKGLSGPELWQAVQVGNSWSRLGASLTQPRPPAHGQLPAQPPELWPCCRLVHSNKRYIMTPRHRASLDPRIERGNW